MTAEEWRPVPGFPYYKVSEAGQVLSLHGRVAHVLKPWVSSDGRYEVVGLRGLNGERRRETVHALVAEAFHGPRPDGCEVRHLDGNGRHNSAANLAYGTRSENCMDRVRHGTHHQVRKTHCPQGHAYEAGNVYLTRKGRGRACRTCTLARSRDAYQRRMFRAAAISERAS